MAVMKVHVKRPGELDHTYTDVTMVSIFPKPGVRDEVDETTYEELPPLLLRIYMMGDERATFGIDEDFSYEIYEE